MNLIELPKDILVSILLFLNDDDITTCERICKRIQSVVNFDVLWKQMCLQVCPNVDLQEDLWKELYESYGKTQTNVN